VSTSYAIGKRRDWGRKTIEEVSDEMRAVIEDLWPELVHKPAALKDFGPYLAL
jgi:hypothetical protein